MIDKLQKWLFLLILFSGLPYTSMAETNGLINIHREFLAFKKFFKFDPQVLYRALQAYDCGVAAGEVSQPGLLTIVDYQLPSNQKRLWVLDLANHKILYNTYVAHGYGSGRVDAYRFSNELNSFQSSIGLYKTGADYFGDWGYAMRLYGLEPGYNNNAYKRNIVFHGGKYVGNQSIAQYGMIGMSHGCFVVPVTLDKEIINTLKNGALVFAYYPNRKWLANSKYLHCSILKKFS